MNSNAMAAAVTSHVVAALQTDSSGYFSEVTALDYDPPNAKFLLSRLPILSVDFVLNQDGVFIDTDMQVGAVCSDYLVIKYFHYIVQTDDGSGDRNAVLAVRQALDVMQKTIANNPSLWGTALASVPHARRIEDIPLVASTITGVSARWCWLSVRVQALT